MPERNGFLFGATAGLAGSGAAIMLLGAAIGHDLLMSMGVLMLAVGFVCGPFISPELYLAASPDDKDDDNFDKPALV